MENHHDSVQIAFYMVSIARNLSFSTASGHGFFAVPYHFCSLLSFTSDRCRFRSNSSALRGGLLRWFYVDGDVVKIFQFFTYGKLQLCRDVMGFFQCFICLKAAV